jgi:hypothetical protein
LKQVDVFPQPRATIACECGATMGRTFREPTGLVRMDCDDCGKPLWRMETACLRYEFRPPDAHRFELEPAPASWEWIGFIRQADGIWRAVALAGDLGRCWDCLLSFPGKGDLLCIPTRPVQRGTEEVNDDES